VSDSVQPHRQQPTRLPRPWDSPGKNTGVGCHFLLQCMKVKNESEVAQRPHGLQPSRLLHPWDFPGKSTGVGCHCLLLVSIYLPLILSKLNKKKINHTIPQKNKNKQKPPSSHMFLTWSKATSALSIPLLFPGHLPPRALHLHTPFQPC